MILLQNNMKKIILLFIYILLGTLSSLAYDQYERMAVGEPHSFNFPTGVSSHLGARYSYNNTSDYINSQSSDIVRIGDDATSYGWHIPYGSSTCQYSATQMLYTPEEIGMRGKINSIAFKVESGSSLSTSEVKIYLGHKSGKFSSGKDYVTSNNLTLVYSGSPTLGQNKGWEKLTFNQDTFNYNGTDNLVVVVTRKSDDWEFVSYYYYETGNGYTLCRYDDSITDYGDVTNTTYSYWNSSNRPTVQLEFVDASPAGIDINLTNFPDKNFRNWLLSQPYGYDGMLTYAEIADVTEINVNSHNIQSLNGIEFFTVLTTLYCDNNQLTTLNISRNTLLKTLGCSKNRLYALDTSKNTKLNWLDCQSNQLTELKVSKNTALSMLNCNNNILTSLDVSKNTELTMLSCRGNQLSYLDVSQNTILKELYCSQNKIFGKNMNNLINSLCLCETSSHANLYVFDDTEGNENNVCTETQVAAAKTKGWIAKYYDGYLWQEYPGVVLELTIADGTDYSNNRNKEYETLHYSRTFKNTYWQAWYVPFDVTLTSEIMEHFAFAKFAGTYTEEDGSFYITVVRMKEGDVVKANTPYCVQAKVADSTNPQVITQTDAILKAAEETSFYVLSSRKKIIFWGNYTRRAVTEADQNVYAMSGGKYSKQKTGNTLGSYRCFFTIEDREDNPYASSTPNPTEVKLMVLGEDDETGIAEIKNVELMNNNAVFDLSGRKVNKQNLNNGIYLINGKKVFIK